MRRYAPLLAHTLRRTCGGRRPELDPAGGVFGSLFFILVFMTIRALNFILLFVPQLVQHN